MGFFMDGELDSDGELEASLGEGLEPESQITDANEPKTTNDRRNSLTPRTQTPKLSQQSNRVKTPNGYTPRAKTPKDPTPRAKTPRNLSPLKESSPPITNTTETKSLNVLPTKQTEGNLLAELIEVVQNTHSQSSREMVRVVSHHTAQQPDELTIRVGDIVEVIRKMADSWWEGDINGRKGFFPSTFTVPYNGKEEEESFEESFEEGDSSEVEDEVEEEDEVEDEVEDDVEEESVESDIEEESDDEISEEGEESNSSEVEDEVEVEEEESEEEKKSLKKDSPLPSPKKVVPPSKIPRVPAGGPSSKPKPSAPTVSKTIGKKPMNVSGSSGESPVSMEKESEVKDHRSHSAFDSPTTKSNSSKELERLNTQKTDPSGVKPRRKVGVEKEYLALQGGDIRKYRDALVAKEREVEELRKEIKILNQMQKRQSRAIKDMDSEKGELPRVLQQMSDELRMYKDKMREYQTKYHTEEKSLQSQHEEILKLKNKIAEMTKVMKAKNLDPSTLAQKLKKEMEKKDKTIMDLEQKTSLLAKVKAQEEKKYKTQLKESSQEIEKLREELDRYKEVLQENGLNRVVRDTEHKQTSSPSKVSTKNKSSPGKAPKLSTSKRMKEKETPSPSKLLSPGFSQKEEKKEHKPAKKKEEPPREPPPRVQSAKKKTREEPKIEAGHNRTETPTEKKEIQPEKAGNLSERKPVEEKKEDLPWKKNKDANLTNPFGKFNVPAPEVSTQPLSPKPITPRQSEETGIRRITFPKSNSQNPLNPSPSQTSLVPPSQPIISSPTPSPSVPPTTITTNAPYDPSKPSWLQGAPVVRQQGDIFKPNMGVGFGRRKDRWKIE